ncbi:Rnf electron transport complex subunit RnfC [Methanococcoides methylutens]|uniref:Ion-translocating oxidoreductase complex subunit C n=1 Tax=Methanococcoides methylutens MM1 TaxID=1434104 RepID=A0A0E3ST58_METMT|nr:Rnf electron transport complex subunit RnfC [Methanococcoides methylutens]AKB85928.1 Electron transport complex protein RnfC [Methanococcoides methylutens MM1]
MTKVNIMKKMPEKVIIPLKQHDGTACDPLVKKGDMVCEGQKIGECGVYNSASVHSSVSGEVISIEEAPHPNGNKVNSVIIQLSEEPECVDFNPKDVQDSELADFIKDAGIVEHYGFPTHMVLKPEGKKIDVVLVNATSSEWIGGHYDTPSQYSSQMLDALKLLMRASGASKGAIVLRNDDLESINAFDGLNYDGKPITVAPLVGKRKINYYFKDMSSDIVVVSQEHIYGKKILDLFTYNVTGRKVSFGCVPTDVGVAICSVKSAKALYDAVNAGKPYIETVVSVSGKVNNPQKILVKIGTTFKDVIEECGGYIGEPGKLIANGSITGVAQYTDEVPVSKTTTSIYVQSADEVVRGESVDCTHCARCVDVCPVNLIPSRIAAMSDQGRFDECRQMHIMNCVECGRCAAVCPSKIHVLQLIKYAKNSIEKAYEDLAPKESPANLKLGCGCSGGE